jgi:4a-hydroxytetrahydrobiopterin dehydratase
MGPIGMRAHLRGFFRIRIFLNLAGKIAGATRPTRCIMSLSQKTCTPCRGGIPPLTSSEAEVLLPQAQGWQLLENGTRIERRFEFRNFVAALAFVNRVGDLAEQEGHHPDITFGWGYANILFYTHKIGGLHENDFIMAAKVNELYAE